MSLVGCGIADPKEAFGEVLKMLPQIQRFLKTFTSWDVTKTRQQQKKNWLVQSSGGEL